MKRRIDPDMARQIGSGWRRNIHERSFGQKHPLAGWSHERVSAILQFHTGVMRRESCIRPISATPQAVEKHNQGQTRSPDFMKLALSLALIAGVIYLVLDMLWLLVVARGLYVAELGPLLKANPNLIAALAFYLLFLAGLTFFVLLPAAAHADVVRAGLVGAAFGLVAYGTYDLTNLATLNGFSTRIALIDMAWGMTVTGITAGGTIALARWFKLVPAA
jgi:uncharacterized membrane protein